MLTKDRIHQAVGKLLSEPWECDVLTIALQSYLLEHIPATQWLGLALDLKTLQYQEKDVLMLTGTIVVWVSRIPDDYECYNVKLVIFTATGNFDIEVE